MRVKIKNTIYLFLAAVIVCLASIITDAHAAESEVSSEISACQFAEQPVRCALNGSKLEVEPLNFTTVGQSFDAAIKFTNNTDKEMAVVDESDSFTHANLKREIFTEEDFGGKLAPGASTTITIRLSYIVATTETLKLNNLGFNITFTPIESTENATTVTKTTTENQPEDLPQNSTNPNTADTIVPFAIFSGSCLILAFVLRRKALGKVCAVAFVAGAAAIPQTTATALDKISFQISFAGFNDQPLAIYINQPTENTEDAEPEIDAEAPTSNEESTQEPAPNQESTEEQTPSEETNQEPALNEEFTEESASNNKPDLKEPTETDEASAPTEESTDPAEQQPKPTETEPTEAVEAPTDNQKLDQEPLHNTAEESPIYINQEEQPDQQSAEESPIYIEPETQPAQPQPEEQNQPIENPITETEPAKTEIKNEEPIQEQALFKGGYKYADQCPGASGYDDWGMTKCQCVSYGANRVFDKHGKFPNWRGKGNAYQWPDNARAEGFIVSPTPKPGAIGVQPRGQYSSYGHVVWVEKVEGDRVFVSEYNWSGSRDYNERWTNASSYQYIYFYEYK